MELKIIDCESKFCLISSCDDDNVTIRFHKIRNEEPLWLSDDLEQYDQPVGYIIV